MSYTVASEISNTQVFSFGDESDTVVVTILSSSLKLSGVSSFIYIPIETDATSLDDFRLNGVTFNLENIIDNVSFDIRADSTNSASGDYTIKYKITYK